MARRNCRTCRKYFKPKHKSDKGVFCSKLCFYLFRKGKRVLPQGYKHSEETKKKISESNKGKHNYWLGKTQSLEHRQKSAKRNERNGMWKGDNAGYNAIHIWIRNRLGKAKRCTRNILHKSTRYHWANISGEYNRDLNDWQELCPSCNKLDGIRIPLRFLEGGRFL